MDEAMMLDFIIRTGVPAGLGVVVVLYLLKVIIPEQQKTFREELASTRKTFEDALRTEQQLHQAMMNQVTHTIQSEGQQTRAALAALDNSTKTLSQTVYKLYGHSMTAFEAAVGNDKKAV